MTPLLSAALLAPATRVFGRANFSGSALKDHALRKLLLHAICSIASVTVSAQIPGQNVNMVTGTKFPGGDPYLQKQNEPSLAISTRNPCRLLGGANDYRAVNLPGLKDDNEIGDAWVGFYTSIDCGQTWYSTLVPGYLQDQTAIGKASPVYGLTAAADPTVRAGAGGFFAYSFIAFNRGSNVGKLAVARFIDKNNKEAVTKAESAITYIDTKVWDTGSAGQFIDKPVVLVTPGTGTCTVGGTVIPASVVHMAWTVFVGNNQNVTTDTTIRTKVYYARSSNCGGTLDFAATKLSEGYATNQGASIGVAANGNVFVVWRQVHSPKGDPDQILFAKSIDGGKSFTKASPIPFITPTFTPFDQATTSKTFRTTAFPTAAVDPSGRLYVAVAVRGFADANQSRIVVTTTTDGINWTMPQAVENLPQIRGHQIMPAMTAVGGKMNLVWIDFRDDVSDEYHDFIQEIYPIRHTMDVRGAQSPFTANGTLSWTTYGILQTEAPAATARRISRYLTGNYPGNPPGLKQLQFNRPNLKLYAGGTRPFVGDYIDVAGLAMIGQHASPQVWLPNDGTGLSSTLTAAQTFYAAWTDNRDAKVGPALPEPIGDPTAEEDENNKVQYAAPGSTCTPAQANLTGTRNANVYEARISPGVFVAAPANSKPSIRSGGDQRAFSILVQNNTTQNSAGKKEPRTFRLHIDNQPSDRAAGTGAASFVQFPYVPNSQPPALVKPLNVTEEIFVAVPPKSSITRTVYVVSTEKYPQIKVSVTEQGVPPGTAPLAGTTLLNPDVENPDVENPDVENPDVENQGVANSEIHNPDVENPDVENPDVENPDVENPDVENPDVENPDVENPDVENPDVENPDVENPDVENPDVENPDVENPDVENSALTDFSVDVSNDGNTTGTYQIKFAVGGNTSGYVYQLIGRRVYLTPTANGCELALKADNQIIFNITDPDISAGPLPEANDPSVSNATVVLKPGERFKATLRAFDKDYFKVLNPNKQGGNDGVVQPFCPIVSTTGVNCPVATNPVDVIVRAGSTNSGETAPRTDVFPTNPDGDLAITTTTVDAASLSSRYAQQLNASGGLPESYNWSLGGGALPPGLSIGAKGLISGVPTSAGTYPFTAKVTDGVQTDTQALTLVVGNGTVLTVATTSLAGGFVGLSYGQSLAAKGGAGSYTWSIASGTLPGGLNLDPSGLIFGTPTAAEVSTFTVRVSDADATASRALTLTTMAIADGDLIVSDGTVGTTTGKLYRMTKDGTTVQLIADIGGRPNSIAQDDSDGSIVTVDTVYDRVLRVTPGNIETLYSGSPLRSPIAVAVLSDGEVVIGDNSTDKLYRLSIDGESVGISELFSLPASATELQDIQIAFDQATGKLFVTDDAGLQVRLITIEPFGETPPTTVLLTGVKRAGGLAINDQGNLVIADFAQQTFFTVTPAGAVTNTLPAATGTNMVGLGINSDNDYYVAVNFANAVKRVTTAGVVTNVHVGGPFTYPTDLIVYGHPVQLFATITDPAGDQLGGGTNPDLVRADATSDGNAITFKLFFGAGTFDAATSWATIYLDLDHNIATGSPGVTSGCTLDANTIGADYFIAVGAQFTPAQVYRVTYPPCASWTVLGTVGIVPITNGYQVTVPLSMIGNDDGRLNFKVAAAMYLGGNSSTGLLDTMPNVGVAAVLLDDAHIVAAMSTRDSPGGTGVGIGGSPSNQKLAQVFRTTYGGTLKEVRVPVYACSAALDLEIQGVNGNGVPDGNVLASQSFPAALDSPPAGVFKRLVLANPLAVTAGTRYAFVLKSAGNCNMDHGPVGNLYADGDGFYDVPENLGWLSLNFGDGGRADLPFQVVVDPQVVVIGGATVDPFQVSPSFNETGVAEVTVTLENNPGMWMLLPR